MVNGEDKKKKKPNVFNPQPNVFNPDLPQSIGTSEQIEGSSNIIKTSEDVPIRPPSYPGEVVTPEFFTPGAKKITSRETEIAPPPEQVIGTSPEIEIQKERDKLLQEELPERRELDPNRAVVETIPIIGPLASFSKSFLNKIGVPFGINSKTDKDLGMHTPETLRTAALTAIEREEIERGLTANELFGAFVEAIPVLGPLTSKYITGLETPTGNAAEVVTNIRKERRRIANIETNVKMGYLPVTAAQEQIKDIEQNIQRLESRVKMLINNSPTLKFNSDGVNTIETEILQAKEKLFQSKNNVLTGKLMEPTEMDLYLKGQQLEEPVEEFSF